MELHLVWVGSRTSSTSTEFAVVKNKRYKRECMPTSSCMILVDQASSHCSGSFCMGCYVFVLYYTTLVHEGGWLAISDNLLAHMNNCSGELELNLRHQEIGDHCMHKQETQISQKYYIKFTSKYRGKLHIL